jgi:hypothetical protein
MAIKSLSELKSLWVTGYKPTQADFWDLFDTIKSGVPESFIFSYMNLPSFTPDFSMRLAYALSYDSSHLKSIVLGDCSLLNSLTFSNGDFSVSQVIDVSGMANLVTCYVNSYNNLLYTGYGESDSISDLSISNVSVGGVKITTIEDLTNATALSTANFSNNNLSQAAVDKVLADIDSVGLHDGELYLNGGTNSAPSAAGLISKGNLVGKGWSVATN